MTAIYLGKESRIALAIVLAVVVIAVSLSKAPTTFSIAASTQYVGFRVSATHRAGWYFRDAEIKRGFDNAWVSFTGAVQIMPGAQLSIQRIGVGPLRLRAKVGKDSPLVARLYGEGQAPIDVEDRLVLVLAPDGADAERHATVLPLIGHRLELGAEITDAPSDSLVLLLGGSVTMLAHTLIGEQRYDAGKVTLALGDNIDLDEVGDAAGILVIGPQAEITAAVRVVARSLRVDRYGALGYTVYATPLARLQKDPALQALWGGALLVFGLLAKLGTKPRKEEEKSA